MRYRNLFLLSYNFLIFNYLYLNFFLNFFNNSLNRIRYYFFLNKLNYFFNNSRNLYYFFFNCFLRNYFLNYSIYFFYFINRNMYSLFDEVRNFFSNDFINCMLNWNHLSFLLFKLYHLLFDNFYLLDSWSSSIDF